MTRVKANSIDSYEASFKVYGENHCVRVIRQKTEKLDAPRLVVVSYLPNETACELLRLCISSIRRHTPEPHELWVVDNCSPPHLSQWLESQPDLNLIFNMTAPVPRVGWLQRFVHRPAASYVGSYANAVALELAAYVVDPGTKRMMTLHMDTMACRTGWLSYLCGRMSTDVRCVGVRMDTTRVRTVHVLGMLFDFSLFAPMMLTFRHNMPSYDTGDYISITLEKAGYSIWGCRNTLWNPELVALLAPTSPYRGICADRSFDDEDQVIFLHLGRGIALTNGGPATGTRAQDWLEFGREVVLQS